MQFLEIKISAQLIEGSLAVVFGGPDHAGLWHLGHNIGKFNATAYPNKDFLKPSIWQEKYCLSEVMVRPCLKKVITTDTVIN
jgi:hypothetical protein